MTRIELLYLDGCPNHQPLHARLRELVSAHDLQATIVPVRVGSGAEARARRFLGSPSVRVDGVDVEPGAAQRTDYGMKCRLFFTPQGLRGMPDEAWMLAALERARRTASET
jgi:hypothetical protein